VISSDWFALFDGRWAFAYALYLVAWSQANDSLVFAQHVYAPCAAANWPFKTCLSNPTAQDALRNFRCILRITPVTMSSLVVQKKLSSPTLIVTEFGAITNTQLCTTPWWPQKPRHNKRHRKLSLLSKHCHQKEKMVGKIKRKTRNTWPLALVLNF